MNLFLFILFYISLWMSSSSSIFKYLQKTIKDYSIFQKQIYLSLSLGFIFSFSLLASLNLLFHLFGITFRNENLLFPITIILITLSFSNIKEIFYIFWSDLKKNYKILFSSIDPFISIILLIIIFVHGGVLP